MQGHLHREPGRKQPGEDPRFPKDQFYNPPEDKPSLSVQGARESADERVELREYRYTKVKVTLRASRRQTESPATSPRCA
jgi:hypothetical protein